MRTLEERHREAARRLLDSREAKESSGLTASLAGFLEALRPELENLIGAVGVRALEGRAVKLASRKHAVLQDVRSGRNGDGVLEGLSRLAEEVDRDELEPAVIEVVAHLVALLASLLGEEITRRLLRRVCPHTELEDVMIEEAPGGAT